VLGRKGGRVRSLAKSAAARENGKRGGRPRHATPSPAAAYRRRRRAMLKLAGLRQALELTRARLVAPSTAEPPML